MKIAFICVNYNNVKFTKEYIDNVLKVKGTHKVTIIVVDNASNQSDIDQLNEIRHDELVLIKSDTNVGYFKGLNLGINAIQAADFDFILIGNNDLTFDESFLTNLENKIVKENVLVIAPNIIRLDGIHQNPHIPNRFSRIARIYRRIYYINYFFGNIMQFMYNTIREQVKPVDRVGHENEQPIIMGYGACYILTENFFKHFKELDAPIFLMGEECIIGNQVLSVDGITLYRPDLIVNHHDHASIGKISNRKLYEFSRASYFYYLKNLKHVQ
ncbi:glycosyltransferase family 2 protein [Pedobacter nyackensis]|uniref:glycosyltransferase family 2 protein n=1 Tax=Pedobacter nyackensis TaxID=475255 RepID=UPI002930E962|nr:glycosyltransferase [Pedobacter nyackensis]